MSFLQPTYLWGLIALAVPLIIHLLNKGDVKTIKVGSIRYLKEQETKQTQQLKLNELWLLLLRMLLLALLVLALAEPTLETETKNTPLTYLIEPSLLKEGQMNEFFTDKEAASVRLLTSGFPELDMDNIPDVEVDYWQLAQEFQELDSDSLVVFSKAILRGIKGMRPRISNKVNWIVLDELSAVDTLVGTTKARDGVLLHGLNGDASVTDIKHEFIPNAQLSYAAGDSVAFERDGQLLKLPLWGRDSIRVGLFYDTEFIRDKEFFSAAFKAVSGYTEQPFLITELQEVKKDGFDVSVWLKSTPAPESDGILVRFRPDSLANDLIEETAQRNRYDLTARLTIESVLNGKLAEHLLQITSARPQLVEAASKLDKRTMASSEFMPSLMDMEPGSGFKKQQFLSHWIWLAALLVLVTERLLSKFRKQ